MPEIQGYFDKMETLDQEIMELQAKKQAVELQTGNTTTCVCGAVLTGKDKFCPHCGAVVDNGMITCVCGNQVDKRAQFCNVCGRNLRQLAEQGIPTTGQMPMMMQPNIVSKPMKQCICGAQVPEGQFMCMECGRKIDG